MKKIQKIGAFILAVVLMFSQFMPYMGTVYAADDLTGWTVGTGSAMGGNSTDGFELSVLGVGYNDKTYGTFYESNICVANLQMELDLSTMVASRNLWLSFDTGINASVTNAWNATNTKQLFILRKTGDSTLKFQAHNGGAEWGIYSITDFNFDEKHTFEYLKDENGKWQPAIDGVLYPMDADGYMTTDAFVTNMFNNYPGKTVVGFATQSGSAAVDIKNVKFNEKAIEGWNIGISSAMLGNETDGYELSVLGQGYADATQVNVYSASTSVANLQVKLDLSTISTGRNLWLSFGLDENASISGAWGSSNTKILFILKKADDSTLQFSAHSGSAEWGIHQITSFDFTVQHTLEFLKDGDGKWQPAIDGTTYATDYSGDKGYTSVDAFVTDMFNNHPDKTLVGFAGQSDSATVNIKNVNFSEKTVAGWSIGTDSAILGDATNGFELSALGVGFNSDTLGNFYPVNACVSDLQVKMDLSTLAAGRNLWMSFGSDSRAGTYGAWDSGNIKVLFILKKVDDTTLNMEAHNGGAAWGSQQITDFDFTTTHTFEFVKDEDGNWQPAIDGTIYSVDTDGRASVDTFVDNMFRTSPQQTIVGFAGQSDSAAINIKNITFSAKVVGEWTIGTGSKASGNSTGGWTLSVLGEGYNNSTYGNFYTANVCVANLQVELDLSTLTSGRNLWLYFGDGESASISGAWSSTNTKELFILRKTGDTTLKFQAHNGGTEWGIYSITDFNFDEKHTLEFLKDENGKWQPAIDGILYPMDTDDKMTTDAFVTNMFNNYPGKTVVGFATQSSSAAIDVKNVRFSEKVVEGWEKGAASALLGNAADGWELSVAGQGYVSQDYVSYYPANASVANLQVNLNLSTLVAGRNLWLSFGKDNYASVSGAWGTSNAKILFIVKKADDTTLQISAHNGGAEWGITQITDFDFSATHTFEFLKDDNGKWQPAMDGIVYPMDTDGKMTTDAFVNNMFNTSPTLTMVGFAGQSDSVAINIKNVNFSEKVSEGWTRGSDSAIIGDATDGFALSITGQGFVDDTQANFYSSNISVADLELVMDLSTLVAGRNLWLSLGIDEKASTSGAWDSSNTKILFIVKKVDDSTLQISAHNGGAEWGIYQITDFDFTTPHIFEFLMDDGGQWQPAIDDILYPMDMEDKMTTDAFVTNMFKTYPGKTVVGFASQNANVVNINSVKFVKKVSEGWTTGTTSSIIGNAESGWTLSMSGNVFSGSQYGNYYATEIPASNFKITFDLSELATGQNLWLILENSNGAPGAWSATKASFLLQKKGDNQLSFVGHTGGAQVGVAATIDFDYSKSHVFEFVKDGNTWKPAIDGTKFEIDCSTFVTGMLANSVANTVVGWASQGSTPLIVKNVQFHEKTTEDWKVGSKAVVSGSASDGWTLAILGDSWESTDNSAYTVNMNVSDFRMYIDLSTMTVGNEFCLAFGHDRYGLQSWSASRVFFMLKRTGDTTLQFYGHNYNTELGKVTIENFDFDSTHTFEFMKDANGVWKPAIDGITYDVEKEGYTTTDEFVTEMITYLGPVTSVGFMKKSSTPCVVKNVKFAPKLTAVGATIATNFTNGAPIKMYFDYTGIDSCLGEDETLVNYGAVLVSKECAASDMQEALMAAFEGDEDNKLSGTSYSEDYKYMFVAGGNEKVPDQYYVIIRNSDDVQYMDRNISAMGYIITETGDGTYQYYFTGNDDVNRTVSNGVIQKSVVSLLQDVCLEYISIYNTADDENKQILENAISTYNTSSGCNYTVLGESNSLEVIAQSTTLSDSDKGLLKAVHLAMYQVPITLKVSDYGAVGDGTTDDATAVVEALKVAKTKTDEGKNVVLKFDKDKSYYFKGEDSKSIFDLKGYKNLTVQGENTTLLLDKTNELVHWFNVDASENITVQGFNLKLSQPMYTMSTVYDYKIYKYDNWPSFGLTDTPYIDIQTDISLGITETYTSGYIASHGESYAFGIPYTEDVNRSHLYINSIKPLDAENNKYRVYLRNYDNHDEKIQYMVDNNLPFMLGIPGWGRYGEEAGSGAVIVTNSTDVNLQDINVWSSPTMAFHMRNNYGTFNINNCNVTTEPGSDDKLAAWVDVFHLKENRCQFIIEDCLLEKAQDDIFNLSTTMLEVNEVYSTTEFNMICNALGGYWMSLEEGDTVTIFDEEEGIFVGRTTIKEVVTQGVNTRIIVNDELTNLESLVTNEGGVAVYVDSLGQPGSIIRNCTVSGTYRFRTPVTVENCTLNTLYAWIDNYPRTEGPLPMDITFKGCTFNPIKPSADQLSAGYISYISEDYMMQIGATTIPTSGIPAQYYAEGILFEDCTIDHTLINFMDNTAYVTLKKDGEVYYAVKPDEE